MDALPPSADLQARLNEIRTRAKALFEAGRWPESLAAHEDALRLAPDAVVIRLSAARIAHALQLQEISLRHFQQAARADPRCYPAVEAARRICIGAGLVEGAVSYSAWSQSLNPTPQAPLSMQLFVPSIATSVKSIDDCRERYARGVKALLNSPPHLDTPSGELGVSGFFLAYHGENDRELLAATARLFLKVIPSLQFTAPHCRSGHMTPRSARRIRIGFISRFFSSHSIFSTSVGLIERLSREKFEVIVLRITPSRDDGATARIRAAADRMFDLDADFLAAREQIAALALDILFFQDIGMDSVSYFLAFARLAPVQCVSFGHPNTTGIPTLDYFISNDAYEPDDAASHYSETLVQLHDLPTLAYYYEPLAPTEPATEASFGLPANVPLYVCPQTLFKIHPDFDRILRGILDRDPHGIVVLISGQFQAFTETLRKRFIASLAGSASRVVFLPFLPFDRFMQLLSIADVVLDTIHFNGMNSSLQAFSVGAPVVTLPGRFQRGRHTQAMYRKMKIDECVARDSQDYIDIAVRIGTDRSYADALRRRILSRKSVLFEDPRVVAEFERFFTGAVNERI